MKKISALITLSLVMCLCMVFPAFAANVNIPTGNKYGMEKYLSYKNFSADYPYRLVFLTAPASQGVSVYCFKTQTPTVNSPFLVYSFGQSGSGSSYGPYYYHSIARNVNDYWSFYYYESASGGVLKNRDNSYYILGNHSTVKLPLVNGNGVPVNNSVDYGNPSKLRELLAVAKGISNDGYTSTSWGKLQAEILKAETILLDVTSNQSIIDNQMSILQSAINGLVVAPVLPDTTELRALLVDADIIENDGYTTSSWGRFFTARKNAHDLLQRTDFTTNNVYDTYTELLSALHGLEYPPVTPPVNPPVTPPPTPNFGVPAGAEKYLDIAGGFSVGHLMPVQDAIMQNLAAGRKFGAWVYFVMLIPLVTVIIVRRTIHVKGEADSIDLNTPSHRSKAYKGTIIKPVQTGEKYTDY